MTTTALALHLVIALALLAGCAKETPDELNASAQLYLAKNDAKAAIVQLKNSLQQDPNSAQTRWLLGKALLESGDPVSATAELRKALDLKYERSTVVPLLARSMISQGEPQKVIQQFADTRLGTPMADADLQTSLSVAYMLLSNTSKADNALRAALQTVPGYPPAVTQQARRAAAEKNYTEALALIEKAIAGAPTDPQAWYHKGEFLFLGRNDLAGANEAFRKTLALKSDHVDARSGLITLLIAEKDLKGAAEQIELLRKLLPNNPQTMFFDAQMAYLANNKKKAMDLIQQVLKAAPEEVRVLQLAGTIQLADGALLEAERSFNQTLSLNPDLPVARRLLAKTYLRLGQPAKALAALKPVLGDASADPQAYAVAGEAYFLTGDFERAGANYQQAVDFNPKSVKSRTALVMSKRQSAGVEATVKGLESIASTDKGIYAELALVSVLIQAKDYVRALKAIASIEAKEPKSATGANLRGRVNLLRGDATNARASFENALSIEPVFVPAATSLATLDLRDKRPDLAKKRFESILAIDPKNLDALISIAEIRALEGAPKEEVAALFDKAIKLNPRDKRPRLSLISYLLIQRDAKSALAAARDGRAAFPAGPEFLDALGRSQAAAGDVNQAITTFNELVLLQPESADAQIRLAGAYLSGGNVAGAKQALNRAIAIMPNHISAQQSLFDLALAEKRPKDALEIARKVKEQRPNALVGYMMEGSAEVARNNVAAAAEVYRGALKRFPVTEPALKLHSMLVVQKKDEEAAAFAKAWVSDHPRDVQFLLHLGELALGRREFTTAEAHFRAVLAHAPANIEALNNVAWIMTKLEKPGALAFAERANSAYRNSPPLMDTLATALAADKQVGKALDVQKQAITLDPANPLLRLNLAKLQIQAGDRASARVELDGLAKLGPKFGAQDEVSRLLKAL
jgi:putative PEP-CTERM system TPR-repeat lipoprotein